MNSRCYELIKSARTDGKDLPADSAGAFIRRFLKKNGKEGVCMKDTIKKITAIILVLAMALGLSVTSVALETETEGDAAIPVEDSADLVNGVITGEAGKDAVFSYDPETRTLTFSGSGAIEEEYTDSEEDYTTYPYVRYRSRAKKIIIGGNITKIGYAAFAFTDVESVVIGDSVREIDDCAFECSFRLNAVKFGKNLKTIGCSAFWGSDMTSLVLPNGVISVGNRAFEGCNSLKYVTLPSSLTDIGENAFGYGSTEHQDGELIWAEEMIPGEYYGPYKIDGFKIIGRAGAKTAEQYARDNGFLFKYEGGAYNPIITLGNSTSGVVVKWQKITGAAKYRVFRKTAGGSYTKIGDTTSTSFTDTTAKNGTKYVYTVRCLDANGEYNSIQPNGKSIVRLLTPSISSLTNVSGRKIKVTWGKKSGVTGYQIQYSTSSTFASGNKMVTVTGASTVSKTISSLTKGKTYYVRVRTYKTMSNVKFYSGWSGKKSVKISK